MKWQRTGSANMEEKFLFGDLSKFAIQGTIFHDISQPDLKAGSICFVCDGEMIGDYEATVILNTVEIMLRQKLNWHNKHLASDLFEMERHDLVEHVEHAFNQCETAEESIRYDSLYLAPGPGEAFDGETILWLEKNGMDRLVWQKFETVEVKEIFMPSGLVTRTIQEFIEFIVQSINGH